MRNPPECNRSTYSCRNYGLLLLTMISLLISFSCSDTYRLIHEDSREKGASIRLSNFRRSTFFTSGVPEWYLKADEAYIFSGEQEGKDRIIAYNLNLEQYDKDGKVSGVVTAKRGEVNHETSTMELEGDVVFTEASGRIIEAQTMSYDMNESILSSKDPVTIHEESMVTRCQAGVKVYRNEEKQVCLSPAGQTIPDQNKSNSQGKKGESLEDLFQ